MNRETAEIVFIAIGLLGGTCVLLHYLTVFKDRTLDEVIGYLRRVDSEEASRLFDPSEEERLMWPWGGQDFRRRQRARLDLARELVECMYYDSRILFHWANTEHRDMLKHHLQYEPETLDAIVELVRAARKFQRIGQIVLVKIRLLSLLNFEKAGFLPIPSVAGLRTVGHDDLLRAFAAVKNAALALAGVYGEEFAEEIRAVL